MWYSPSMLQEYANFLRDCDFLGQRASELAKELASLLEEHIESDLAFDGMPYYGDFLCNDE